MKLLKNVLLFPVIIFSGTIAAFVINAYIIEPVCIGDKCRYHMGDDSSGFLLNLFYDINIGTNHHPDPSLVNIVSTIALGTILGIVVYVRVCFKGFRREKFRFKN